MGTTVLLHDFAQDLQLPPARDFIVINAPQKAAACKGCFGCWLKTPGICVMRDEYAKLGSLLMSSERVILISKCLYGGFDQPIKRLLDRSIGGNLPFFSHRAGRMHHLPRYQNQPVFEIYFYQCAQMTEQEKLLAQKVAVAVSINYNASKCDVTLLPGLPDMGEVLYS